MNQIEDQTSDSDLGKVTAFEPSEKPQMIRGEYTFQGKPLWPYTLGTRIIFNQVIEPKDKMLFVWAAFVFLMLRRGESTASEDRKKHLLPMWDSGNLRSEVLEWVDGLSEQDLIEAKGVYDKWMESEKATSVEPVPREGLPVEKKTRQRKQRSSAGS